MDSLRSVIARIKPLLKTAGVDYARSHPSRIRGMRSWGRGVVVRQLLLARDGYRIVSFYWQSEAAAKDVATAVAACRAAGWTVEDDGTILSIPPKPVGKVPRG